MLVAGVGCRVSVIGHSSAHLPKSRKLEKIATEYAHSRCVNTRRMQVRCPCSSQSKMSRCMQLKYVAGQQYGASIENQGAVLPKSLTFTGHFMSDSGNITAGTTCGAPACSGRVIVGDPVMCGW